MVPLIVTMLVAVFVVHWADAFGMKEMTLLYLASYITIAISGAGKYSVDNIIAEKINF